MSLSKKNIKSSFSAVTYQRGKRYYEEGMVFNVHSNQSFGDVDLVFGVAKGSHNERYDVEAWIDGGEFVTECSCPVSNQCKHGVALILEAFDDGLYKEPAKIKRIPAVKKSEMQAWIDKLESNQLLAKSDDTDLTDKEFLVYLVSHEYDTLQVSVRKTKYNKKGEINKGALVNLHSIHRSVSYNGQDDYVSKMDSAIFSDMFFSWDDSNTQYEIDNAASVQILIKMIETGRCYFETAEGECFEKMSDQQTLEFNWTEIKSNKTDAFKLEVLMNGRSDFIVLPSSPLYYLNVNTLQIGQIDTDLNEQLLMHLTELPAIKKQDAQQFSMWLFDNNLPIPTPVDLNVIEIKGVFQPVFEVCFDEKTNFYYGKFHYQYGEFMVEHDQYEAKNPTVFNIDNQMHRWQRDLNAEKNARLLLKQCGLFLQYKAINGGANVFTSDDPFFWVEFKLAVQVNLEHHGWRVELNELKLPQIHEIEHVEGNVIGEESEYDNWFELGLSVTLNNEKIDLVPLLIDGLAHIEDWENLPDKILVPNKGDFLKFNKKDVQPIIRILSQLANKDGKIGRYHADVLNHIPFVDTWSGDKKIKSLAKKLGNYKGIKTIKSPKGLNAELRDYQQQGLNWLGFLQEYGFGGILADDMGLGKTIQALSMMQVLFNRKKITQPMIVVCPTSLVGNWRSEAAKFAPKLKVFVLHGSKRHEHFESINDYHLIITTYPLIQRDIDIHKQHNWLWIILDEAQVIKNPKAKMTQAIKELKGKHRLCLTGTPMENHLGELWSLFDFLMPGFLNNHKGFTDLYRKPIEAGDAYAQQWLNDRVKPFLLRRTKDAVATELPGKTEIIQNLEMPTDQRKLYESIRVTMEKRVRQLLKEKGIAKSQIEFLDALLKLRQACCHPALVKLDEAKKVKHSAKLDFLLEVLPEMLEEGRKVLIFSQFAQMLTIIEDTLNKHKIKTTKLTGQTRKREEVINRFTSGEVDVFLISLKAGGVGLNLTQADTVIHFDPWWNPAAENQATDRAYRIGQDKPVFVYKLVTQNSIEERVLELQKKKQAMADAVYEGKSDAQLGKMDSNQLLSLFGIEK
ncbi:SNF2-related protein [Marinicellulosiphila megalodicopiae]|uniref:DEAD/DEAH box helicase n=1 Tax=Marinicellulosiphila megalodicopiae TaxID=2724896 RepID=UPI003BAF3FDD